MKYQIGQRLYKLHKNLRTTNPTNCDVMFNDYQKTKCYVVFKIINIGYRKDDTDPYYLLIKDECFEAIKKHFEDNWNLYDKEYKMFYQFYEDFMQNFYNMQPVSCFEDHKASEKYYKKLENIELQNVSFFDKHYTDWAENYEEYWKKTEESFDINKSQLAREIELTKKKLAKLEAYKEKFDNLEVK